MAKRHKVTQRYFCLGCRQTFTESFDTLYYRRQLKPEEIHTILQSDCFGISLRRLARISGRAYGSVIWMWQHSRFGTTAAQRAGLASDS